MSLSSQVRKRLAAEGLEFVADLVDFKAEQLKEFFKNIRSAIPGAPCVPQVMDAQGRVQFPAIQLIPPTQGVNISAKCYHRLKIASVAFHYYRLL